MGLECILSGFYSGSLGRGLFGITKCTGRNSREITETEEEREKRVIFHSQNKCVTSPGSGSLFHSSTSAKRVLEFFLNQSDVQSLTLRVTGYLLTFFFIFYFYSVIHFSTACSAHLTHDSQRTVGNRNKQTFYEYLSFIVSCIIFFPLLVLFFVFFIFKNRRKKEHIAHKNI